MRWVEPREIARARASFWNQPRIIAPLILYSVIVPFAAFGLTTAIAIRLQNGHWDWKTSLLMGIVSGLIFGIIHFINKPLALQQEIELRERDFIIRGSSEHCMPYDQLRGYSIIQAPLGNIVCRTLLLYPKTDGHFSIGLPENIPDSAIHVVLSQYLLFVTIFDMPSLDRDPHVTQNQ